MNLVGQTYATLGSDRVGGRGVTCASKREAGCSGEPTTRKMYRRHARVGNAFYEVAHRQSSRRIRKDDYLDKRADTQGSKPSIEHLGVAIQASATGAIAVI